MKEIKIVRYCFWILIGFIVFVPIILCGNNPGLYLDAVNPDYISVQLAFPQTYQERWQVSWPFLAQIYHGNVGVLFSYLVIKITGATSILQHHLLNGVYNYIIFIFLYAALKECGIREKICKGVIIIGASMQSFFLLCFTQFYIELPGSVFTMLAIYLLVHSVNKYGEITNRNLLCGSVLLGLAFYSYFNYFFFFIPFYCLLIFILRKDDNFFKKMILSSYGLLGGG